MTSAVNIVIFIFLPSVTLVTLIIFLKTCRQYYDYLKNTHKDIWFQLMMKDPMIEAAGEWIRWPIGSVQFLWSVFDISKDYGDKTIYNYKTKAKRYGIIFIVLFLVSMAIMLYLDKQI